ncbi:hypothetical protein, partial [Chromobacterium sp. Panama]|uniref:hypothetical protein n=1 Tax=Chromobacterium sp. Panama TaxID=2161826 RepID=UPI0018EE5B72
MKISEGQAFEVGLVLYPGAQQAAVLGLTDLLGVASVIAASYQNVLPLRISHWKQDSPTETPTRVFDNGMDSDAALVALILPPSLRAANKI